MYFVKDLGEAIELGVFTECLFAPEGNMVVPHYIG